MFTGFQAHCTTSASQARTRLLQALLAAALAGVGLVHAADEEKPAEERPLVLSLPRAASDASGVRKTPAAKDIATKPYGSGYEARGLDATKRSPGLVASAASSALAPSGALGDRAWPTGAGSRSHAGSQRGGGAGRGGRR